MTVSAEYKYKIFQALWSTTGHGLAVVSSYSLYYSDGPPWTMVLVRGRGDTMVRVGVPDLLYQGRNTVPVTHLCFNLLLYILHIS